MLMEVFSNDGSIAQCLVYTEDGTEEVQFVRRKESQTIFLAVLPVGTKKTMEEFMEDAQRYEKGKR